MCKCTLHNVCDPVLIRCLDSLLVAKACHPCLCLFNLGVKILTLICWSAPPSPDTNLQSSRISGSCWHNYFPVQGLQGLWERGTGEGMQWGGEDTRWHCDGPRLWLVANKGLQALSWICSIWWTISPARAKHGWGCFWKRWFCNWWWIRVKVKAFILSASISEVLWILQRCWRVT